MNTPLQPAASIIDAFGGSSKVQEITGVGRTGVYRWTQPKQAGGTGGMVPTESALKLLRYARQTGIPVTADHFLPVDPVPCAITVAE